MTINYYHSSRCKGCLRTDELFKDVIDIDSVPVIKTDINDIDDVDILEKLNIITVPVVIITEYDDELVRFNDDDITYENIQKFLQNKRQEQSS